jgi:hypothetical protein
MSFDPLQPAVEALPRLNRACTAHYAGDMLRGFDVYRAADCNGVGCSTAG